MAASLRSSLGFADGSREVDPDVELDATDAVESLGASPSRKSQSVAGTESDSRLAHAEEGLLADVDSISEAGVEEKLPTKVDEERRSSPVSANASLQGQRPKRTQGSSSSSNNDNDSLENGMQAVSLQTEKQQHPAPPTEATKTFLPNIKKPQKVPCSHTVCLT